MDSLRGEKDASTSCSLTNGLEAEEAAILYCGQGSVPKFGGLRKMNLTYFCRFLKNSEKW
jgi:hypothetical protein